MKRLMLGLAVIAMGLTSFARTIPDAARTVSVTASNPGKGVVQLAFSAAPEGDMTTNFLYAVRADEDKGKTHLGWDEVRYLGEVTPETMNWTVRLPMEWATSVGKIRFALGTLAFARQVSRLRAQNTTWVSLTDVIPDKDTETTVRSIVGNSEVSFGVEGYHLAFNNGNTGLAWSHFGNGSGGGIFPDWYTYEPYAEHVWVIGPNGCFLDGHQLDGPYTTFAGTSPQPLALFGRVTAGGTINTDKKGTCSIYSVKIRQNGELIRDLVPCQDFSGANVFYDLVEGKFYGPVSGTGTLEVPDTTAVTPSFGAFSAMSMTDALDFDMRTMSVTSFDRASGTVSLTFGTGAAKQLYAVHDDLDKGLDWLDWKENAYLGEVAAAATTGSFALPTNWLTTRGTVRFVLSDTDALPEGYTRIEYVGSQNNAQQTIDTGVYPDSKTSIRIVTNVGEGSCSFGVTGDPAGGYLVFENGGGSYGIYTSFFGASPSLVKFRYPELGTKHVIDFGPDGVRIAGKRYFDPFVPTTDGPLSTTLTLMKRHVPPGSTTDEKKGAMSVYSAYIERDGIAVRSYVPVVRTSDSKYGMWDFITKELHADSGEALTHGAATTAHELLPQTGKVVSRAFVLGPTIVVTGFDSMTGELALSFSGAVGKGELYLAGSIADLGTVPSAWSHVARLGSVGAADAGWSGHVPADFLNRSNKTMRVFFVGATEKPFDYQATALSGWSYRFDTGVRPDRWLTTEIEHSVAATANSDCAPFGIEGEYSLSRAKNTGSLSYDFFGYSKSSIPSVANDINVLHTFKLGPDGVFVDGVRKADPFFSCTSDRSASSKGICLAGRWSAAGSVKDQNSQTLGRCKMTHDGVTVRDMVPCVKDGTAGFWDYQTQKLYVNQVSGKSSDPVAVFYEPLTDATFGSCSEPFQRQVGMIMIVK